MSGTATGTTPWSLPRLCASSPGSLKGSSTDPARSRCAGRIGRSNVSTPRPRLAERCNPEPESKVGWRVGPILPTNQPSEPEA